jgi:hypothetical protein
MVRRLTRSDFARLALALVLFLTIMPRSLPAEAAWQSSGWKCVDGGGYSCKYGQGRVRWDTALNPDRLEVSWWGGIGSACPGGATSGQWRLQQAKIKNDATGADVTATGNQPYRTNGECLQSAGPPTAWFKQYSANKPSNASAHWWFNHNTTYRVCEAPTQGAPVRCRDVTDNFSPYVRIDF